MATSASWGMRTVMCADPFKRERRRERENLFLAFPSGPVPHQGLQDEGARAESHAEESSSWQEVVTTNIFKTRFLACAMHVLFSCFYLRYSPSHMPPHEPRVVARSVELNIKSGALKIFSRKKQNKKKTTPAHTQLINGKEGDWDCWETLYA